MVVVIGMADVVATRAVAVRERFERPERHGFLTGAALKERSLRETPYKMRDEFVLMGTDPYRRRYKDR